MRIWLRLLSFDFSWERKPNLLSRIPFFISGFLFRSPVCPIPIHAPSPLIVIRGVVGLIYVLTLSFSLSLSSFYFIRSYESKTKEKTWDSPMSKYLHQLLYVETPFEVDLSLLTLHTIHVSPGPVQDTSSEFWHASSQSWRWYKGCPPYSSSVLFL